MRGDSTRLRRLLSAPTNPWLLLLATWMAFSPPLAYLIDVGVRTTQYLSRPSDLKADQVVYGVSDVTVAGQADVIDMVRLRTGGECWWDESFDCYACRDQYGGMFCTRGMYDAQARSSVPCADPPGGGQPDGGISRCTPETLHVSASQSAVSHMVGVLWSVVCDSTAPCDLEEVDVSSVLVRWGDVAGRPRGEPQVHAPYVIDTSEYPSVRAAGGTACALEFDFDDHGKRTSTCLIDAPKSSQVLLTVSDRPMLDGIAMGENVLLLHDIFPAPTPKVLVESGLQFSAEGRMAPQVTMPASGKITVNLDGLPRVRGLACVLSVGKSCLLKVLGGRTFTIQSIE